MYGSNSGEVVIEKFQVDESKAARQREKDQMTEEIYGFVDPCPPAATLCMKVFNTMVTFALIGVLIYYTTLIVKNYRDDRAHPGTAVSFLNNAPNEKKVPLDYPAITICNVQPGVEMDFVSCEVANKAGKGADTQYTYCDDDKVVDPRDDIYNISSDYYDADTGGLWCYSINTQALVPTSYNAQAGGFANSISITVDPHFVEYPKDAPYFGVIVLFSKRETENLPDYEDVMNAQYFADGSQANFFAIKKTEKKYITKLDDETYWEASTSFLASNTVGFNSSEVDLTIFYNSLATEVVKEQYTYKLTNLLGDFAGMAGTLLGMDVMKALFLGETLPRALQRYFRHNVL